MKINKKNLIIVIIISLIFLFLIMAIWLQNRQVDKIEPNSALPELNSSNQDETQVRLETAEPDILIDLTVNEQEENDERADFLVSNYPDKNDDLCGSTIYVYYSNLTYLLQSDNWQLASYSLFPGSAAEKNQKELFTLMRAQTPPQINLALKDIKIMQANEQLCQAQIEITKVAAGQSIKEKFNLTLQKASDGFLINQITPVI